MALKLFSLLTFTSLALVATIFAATPTNALATGGHNFLNRQVPHETIARRIKRDNNSTKRCKPRPTTSLNSSVATISSKTSSSVATSTTSEASRPSSKAQPPASSSAPPASSAPQVSSGNKKVGLGWPNGPVSSLQNYNTSAVGWIYSWSPYTPDPDHQYPNMQFMAQLWGYDQISDFESVVTAGYANFILGPNEPNEPSQSNMSPQDGASLWKQYIEPKRALGYKTCSPATSSNPNGFTWVADWVTACDGGCTFDYVCVHWYDVQASDFMSYVEKWHNIYNKDIFITEFAPQNFNGGAQPTIGEIWAFYQEVMPWIISTPWILAACPYGFMHDMGNVNVADQLMSSGGQPTALGSYIIDGNY